MLSALKRQPMAGEALMESESGKGHGPAIEDLVSEKEELERNI